MNLYHLILNLILLSVLAACNGGGGGAQAQEGKGNSGPDVNGATDGSSGADPLYQFQWHLKNTGQTSFSSTPGKPGVDINQEAVISSGIDGAGVRIAISDTGIEVDHEDLSPNFLAGVSKNFLLGSPYNGYPVPDFDNVLAMHGTGVAGIIAAASENNLGGRGVAPKAKFAGFNYLAKGVTQTIDKTLYQMMGDFDIFNYSYGSTPIFYNAFNSPSDRAAIIGAYEDGTSSGRSGKGSIYIKSAGNEFKIYETDNGTKISDLDWDSPILGNAALLESNNYPYTILVGAINAKGEKSSYSSPGSNIWISAPGGEFGDMDPAIVTTDFSGCAKGISRNSNTMNQFEPGLNSLNIDCRYTSTMNGTSSAAPAVSGVVALMLDANQDLTWRDVKHILASTAVLVDPYTGSYPHPLGAGYDLSGHTYQMRWVKNAANFWFNNYYGFGLVDSEAAVSMAKSYGVNLGQFKQTIDSLNKNWIYDSGIIAGNIPNNSAIGLEHIINVKHNYKIEATQIKVTIDHGYIGNIGIELTSPSGTKSIIANINSNNASVNLDDAVFLTNAFYGEQSLGDWRIKVIDGQDINADGSSGSSGKLIRWKINIEGHIDPVPADATIPAAPASVTSQDYFNSTTTSPVFIISPSSSGDVIRYEYCVGTVPGICNLKDWSSIGSLASFYVTGLTLTNNSTYYLSVVAVDSAENISVVVGDSWTVNTTAPSTPAITSHSSGFSYYSTSINLSGTCSANTTPHVTVGSNLTVSSSSSCNVAGVFSINLTISGPYGPRTLSFYTRDGAGNDSATVSFSFFYFTDLAPTISSVSPSVITEEGLSTLVLTGSGFRNGATVTVGGQICSNLNIVSTTSANCIAPALSAGLKTLVFNNNDSQSASSSLSVANSWTLVPKVASPNQTFNGAFIWDGQQFLTWGGNTRRYSGTSYFEIPTKSGHRFDVSTSTWTQIDETGAPLLNQGFQKVWTGQKLIVWGESSASVIGGISGGIYTLSNDTWSSINTTNAPPSRSWGTAVWTGSKMIVWGGSSSSSGSLNTGSVYDLASDTWTSISITGAPARRSGHTAIWTGTEMIVWGGENGSAFNNGAKYNPTTNTWSSIAAAPIAQRSSHAEVWTGDKMIVWGGRQLSGSPEVMHANGAVYNPSTNTWTTMSNTNAPEQCYDQAAVWTGKEMIVFGGTSNSSSSCSTKRYVLSEDKWYNVTSNNQPDKVYRSSIYGAFDGSRAVFWGGAPLFQNQPNDQGGLYLPPAN